MTAIRADVRARFLAIVARATERADAEREALGTRRDQGSSTFKQRSMLFGARKPQGRKQGRGAARKFTSGEIT
jgi:hypothetical protein